MSQETIDGSVGENRAEGEPRVDVSVERSAGEEEKEQNADTPGNSSHRRESRLQEISCRPSRDLRARRVISPSGEVIPVIAAERQYSSMSWNNSGPPHFLKK